jgi:hypothetical protein
MAYWVGTVLGIVLLTVGGERIGALTGLAAPWWVWSLLACALLILSMGRNLLLAASTIGARLGASEADQTLSNRVEEIAEAIGVGGRTSLDERVDEIAAAVGSPQDQTPLNDRLDEITDALSDLRDRLETIETDISALHDAVEDEDPHLPPA